MPRFQLRVSKDWMFDVTEMMSDDLDVSMSLPAPDDPDPVIAVNAKNLNIIDALHKWAQSKPEAAGLSVIANNVEYAFAGRTSAQLKDAIEGKS
jgi:hypothetical protein